VRCTGDEVVVETNGIPHYTFTQLTPMELTENDRTFRFPLNPELAAETTSARRDNGDARLGYFGAVVNGMPFYGPTENADRGPSGTVPFGDPVFNGLTDNCQGHGNPFHFHGLKEFCLAPSGLVAEPWESDYPLGMVESPILAFAADGFPVYGSYECADEDCSEMREMRSSYELIDGGSLMVEVWDNVEYIERNDPSYLDECNGHSHGDRGYHYHRTETFPYIIGCFKGTPTGIMGNGGRRP
jgi:hypothetical protein